MARCRTHICVCGCCKSRACWERRRRATTGRGLVPHRGGGSHSAVAHSITTTTPQQPLCLLLLLLTESSPSATLAEDQVAAHHSPTSALLPRCAHQQRRAYWPSAAPPLLLSLWGPACATSPRATPVRVPGRAGEQARLRSELSVTAVLTCAAVAALFLSQGCEAARRSRRSKGEQKAWLLALLRVEPSAGRCCSPLWRCGRSADGSVSAARIEAER